MTIATLEGKTAVVTGAASGIGLGIATALAQGGATVMMCDIEAAALEAARDSLRHTHAEIDSVVADVSLKQDLQAAADATIRRFGTVDILVNNAGICTFAWTDKNWDWILDVNLRSVIWGFEIFGPLIERSGAGGHIVSTASVGGLVAGSADIGYLPYTVTKYGVAALSEGLRETLAPRGIGVSLLCPGMIRTRIMESDRNLPDRFATAERGGPSGQTTGKLMGVLENAVSRGIDPLYVGELVCEGILGNWAYIFTDMAFEPAISARFEGIRRGFDMLRDRHDQPA